MSLNQIWISSGFLSDFSSGFLANWIGTPILGDYFQENRTSWRPFLLLRISFPGRPIFIQLVPGNWWWGAPAQSPLIPRRRRCPSWGRGGTRLDHTSVASCAVRRWRRDAIRTQFSKLMIFKNSNLSKWDFVRQIDRENSVNGPQSHSNTMWRPVGTKIEDFQGIYRVFHQLVDLGWVDIDLGCSIILPNSSAIPICLSKIGQIAEPPRSKSTQQRSSSW